MELPDNLKQLYRHWDGHVVNRDKNHPPLDFVIEAKILEELSSFINARMAIWQQKITGQLPPYTTDPILTKYRFCNIFRELDRQTIEFHTMLKPLCSDFPLWLMNMFLCRMIAKPETIKNIGLLSFNKQKNEDWYYRLINSERPRYGNAYVFPVSVIQKSIFPTREKFLANHLPAVTHDIANFITTWHKQSVYDGVEKILPHFGFNLKFLWTEVLIDVAYQFPDLIDLFNRFPIGPGAMPTFKRINQKHDPSLLAQKLTSLTINTHLTFNGPLLALSAENWEGIGCEFRKYTNLQASTGRKRLYTV